MMASTFHRIELEQSIKQRDDNINEEQQRIARDVHDALGHSLAYLRLRLDQISMELDQTRTDTLQQDVESLRDVAKEAYDQMRGILIMLSPDQDSDLDSVLMSYADKIRRQVNFQIKFHRHGLPRTLPAPIQHNIFYIFQESLTNIEKHAHAQQVDVELSWQETYLEVKVTDDGIGYDPAPLIASGHFGLSNMRERALASKADLSISSELGHGAQLKLRVPYEVQL
jgi:signal transduction histidine kinase